jgi:predicted Zn-ribbon and HTH transcriptional regulator
MNIVLTKLTCKKCGYEWFPKVPVEPKVCPRCKSYKWHEVKKRGIKNNA